MNVNNSLFHIHTYRCNHAENISDEEYVKEAIRLNASDIWFTDHAPFPGNIFGNRMKYEQLDEYLNTLTELKKRYLKRIHIHIGLEIEYFPSFNEKGYYKTLINDPRLDILLLGQHMAEVSSREGIKYTFEWDKDRLYEEEFLALGEAIIEGIKTGYFSFLAHPDRIYRRRKKEWTKEMNDIAIKIIQSCSKADVPMEINMHSINCKGYYRPEFWKLLTPDNKTIIGLDAHSIEEMQYRYKTIRSNKITLSEASNTEEENEK